MDEFDEISEEELLLAAALAERLDRGTGASVEDSDGFEELATHAALLRASKNLDLSEARLTSGRAEVEAFAHKSLLKREQARPKRAWLMWLPLPAIGVLALVFSLSPTAERHRLPGDRADASVEKKMAATALRAEAVPTAKEQASAPASPTTDGAPDRWHQGEVPPELLKAQTLALTSRLNGNGRDAEESRAALDREMRGYRARLLARLDVEGR